MDLSAAARTVGNPTTLYKTRRQCARYILLRRDTISRNRLFIYRLLPTYIRAMKSKTMKSSSTASCCLQCRIVILALAVAANGVLVEALRTVLDPNGLPLLQPAQSSPGGLHDDISCKDTTTTRAWGGFRSVDLVYLVRNGSIMCRYELSQ